MQKKLFGKRSAVVSVLLTLLIVSAFALPSKVVSAEKEVNWDFNMWAGRRAWTIPLEQFIADMEKQTNGRWKISLHYGGVLSPPKESLDGIKAGMFQGSGLCVAYTPGKTPLHRVIELPFLAPTKTLHIQKLAKALWEHPALKKELLKWNAVPFLPAGLCQFHLMGNKPVRSVADLKGARIRIGGDIAKVLKVFGTVPTLVPAPECYEALSRGTVELIGFAYTYGYGSYKIHEVSKYVMLPMSFGTMNCTYIANKDAYDALPEEFKKLHKEWYEKAPEKWAAAYQQADDKWEPIFKKRLEYIEFPASERAKLVAQAQKIWANWAKEMEKKGLPGTDVLNFALKKRKEIAGY
jgi:TRAP-type C4-dicarboxylate transport system substrate-binding protein